MGLRGLVKHPRSADTAVNESSQQAVAAWYSYSFVAAKLLHGIEFLFRNDRLMAVWYFLVFEFDCADVHIVIEYM